MAGATSQPPFGSPWRAGYSWLFTLPADFHAPNPPFLPSCPHGLGSPLGCSPFNILADEPPRFQFTTIDNPTVLIVDKCPEEWAGGNGYFTAGAHRTAHEGLADLLPLLANASPAAQLSRERLASVDVEPYTTEDFAADIDRLGGGRADPEMVRAVVEGSREALRWLAETARLPFVLSFNRQAYEVDGRMKFWGGMALSVEEGGKGLIKAWQTAVKAAGIETKYDTEALRVTMTSDEGHEEVSGLVVRAGGREITISTTSVVLAAGGFEANKEMRRKYLGEKWINAKVRQISSCTHPVMSNSSVGSRNAL